jgi:hypothetical protein
MLDLIIFPLLVAVSRPSIPVVAQVPKPDYCRKYPQDFACTPPPPIPPIKTNLNLNITLFN